MPSPSRSRPVDALFGDDNVPDIPNYIVEPAQPVTTVAPPPVEKPSRAPVVPPAKVALPTPALPVIEPVAPTLAPIVVPTTPSPGDARFVPLAERIERLYGEVKMDLLDSKVATDFCLGLLMQARQAVEARDYARAEFCIQSVDAKLKRSQRSMKAARGLGVIFLWVWEVLALVIGGGLLALTYVMNLTLFGLPVASEFVVLLRAIGWGVIGGVIGALYNLPWFIQFREYDPAYAMNYFARPVLGGLIGALLYLISQAGVFGGNGNVPTSGQLGPILLYVISALAGFKQEYVTEFFDSLLKAIFRIPQVPNELKPPQSK